MKECQTVEILKSDFFIERGSETASFKFIASCFVDVVTYADALN